MDPNYTKALARLSASSVSKHFDAYADIDWDHPDHRIDHDDPRFELGDDEPLGATDWYRSLRPEQRARIGLHTIVSMLKTGIEFESILSRGLLEFASTRPNGSAEFRYAYHEVIEEGQHSLMFQEFINRSGIDARGLRPFEVSGSRRVPRLGRVFPELFFLHVLGGEAPADYVQRRSLIRSAQHPLLRRIMQIHVLEEARHISFADRYLENHVPLLGAWATMRLRVFAPIVLAGTVGPMLRIPDGVVRAHAIPREIVRAVHRGATYRERVVEALRPVRRMCERLGLLTARAAPVWRWLGLAPSMAS